MMTQPSSQDFYSRSEVMGILQITAMELGELLSKGVLQGQQIKGKSFFPKADVEYYFLCLENADFVYEAQAEPWAESAYNDGVYSSLNTVTLLGINEFELDFLIRSRLLNVFYRGFNWFFPKVQIDDCANQAEAFRREIEVSKRHSGTQTRPINTFIWPPPNVAPLEPPSSGDLEQFITDESEKTAVIRPAPGQSLMDSIAEFDEELEFTEPPPIMFGDEGIEVNEVLDLLDLEEYELDLLIAERSLQPYLKDGVLIFSKVEAQRYHEKLKAQNLVCAEENMEELLEALEDGVYSFRETRARLFLTEFQMELLERSGALTVFRKGIHHYFNRARVDELEGDPNAFAQLVVSAKRAGIPRKSLRKRVHSYTKKYRKTDLHSPATSETDIRTADEKAEEMEDFDFGTTLEPLEEEEEEIIEIKPLMEAIPVEDSEEKVDTSALLPKDTSSLLPPDNEEEVKVDIKKVLKRAQKIVRIRPARAGLIPQTRGKYFNYTQAKVVLQMDVKELQGLIQKQQLTEVRRKNKVYFAKEQVLALRKNITSVEIEEF